MTKRIFRAIALVALVVFLASLVLIMGVLYNYFSNVQLEQLRIETNLAAQGVASDGEAYLDSLDIKGYRITWIDSDGSVIYDSRINSEGMENHLEREEVREAITNGYGESTRYSSTLMQKSVYSAQRLDDGTIIRVSDEHSSMLNLLFSMIQPILLVALVTLVLALVLASRVSKRVVAPLNNLDLDNPLENENVDEVAPLLRRINSQQLQLKIQEIELNKKKEEFETVIQSMTEGLVLLGREGRIISINNAARKIFDAGEFLTGKSILEVCRNIELQKLTQAALKGESVEKILEISEKEYQVDASPTYYDNEISGAAVLIFDVTEKQQAEQMRREFTANVSHELKTPLHSISGCAELLCNDMVKKEDVKQFTGQIYTEAQRMMRLVNDIIYLSQLDEGAVNMQRGSVDIYKLAAETAESLKPEAERMDVTVTLTGDSAVISGISQLLASIVYNLCDNAIKYNRKGGRVAIDVRNINEPNECYAVLTVSDTGIGISPEHQKRIFERFYRVDKSHSKEVGGTGLGLSIVKHAAKLHNAEIDLVSKVDEGTTIKVKFPRGE